MANGAPVVEWDGEVIAPKRKGADWQFAEILLQEGKSPKEIAHELGVNVNTVHNWIKRRRKSSTELIVSSAAKPLVRQKIRAMDQLGNINDKVNLLLNKAMAGLEAIEDEEFEDPLVALEAVRMMGVARDVALKSMAEIRGQIKLQLEIFQALYDVRAAEEFQKEVMNAIGEVDAATRDRIFSRLRQRRAVRQTLQPN